MGRGRKEHWEEDRIIYLKNGQQYSDREAVRLSGNYCKLGYASRKKETSLGEMTVDDIMGKVLPSEDRAGGLMVMHSLTAPFGGAEQEISSSSYSNFFVVDQSRGILATLFCTFESKELTLGQMRRAVGSFVTIDNKKGVQAAPPVVRMPEDIESIGKVAK